MALLPRCLKLQLPRAGMNYLSKASRTLRAVVAKATQLLRPIPAPPPWGCTDGEKVGGGMPRAPLGIGGCLVGSVFNGANLDI